MGEYSEEAHIAAEIARLERVAGDDWAGPSDTDEIEVGPPGRQNELVNLGAVWDRIEAPGWTGMVPTLVQVPGYDHRLFYPGFNSVAGGSGSAKSWLGQIVAAQVLAEDQVPVVLDVETGRHPEGWVDRLRLIGVDRERATENLVYVNWQSGSPPVDEILEGLRGRRASFVVVDSVPEAMARAGENENSAFDVIHWHRQLEASLMFSCGPDVVTLLIDGLPKGWAPGQDARGGVGSARKLYAVETAWRLYPKFPRGSRTVDGFSTLQCTKDRYGTHEEGATIAELFYGPSGFGLRRHVPKSEVDGEKVRAAVLEFIEASGPPGLNNPTGGEIKTECGAGSAVALRLLLDSGEVRDHKPPTGRPGGPAIRYYAVKLEPDPEG